MSVTTTTSNNPTIRHCYSCGLQNQHLEHQQYPLCNQKSDSITIQKHWMCIKCNNAFKSVKQFATKFSLKWFDPEFKIQQIIDLKLLKFSHLESSFVKENKRRSTEQLFAGNNYCENNYQYEGFTSGRGVCDGTKMLELNLPNDVYSAVVLDQIEKEDLHHLYWLPKTVLYLIHLTQRDKVRPEERRQRVKKTLQVLSYLYGVNQSELKPLAIIIHTLYCVMNEQSLLKITDRLLRGMLQNSIPLQLFFIDEIYQVQRLLQEKHQHMRKKPIEFRPDNLLYVIHSIFVLLDFFRDSKLHKHVTEIVHLSHEELARQRQQSYESHKVIEKVFENYLKTNISEKSSKLTKLSHSSFQQLLSVRRQRNHLELIMRTIRRQQEENQEIMKQMESKFKKEKDQYINKIVKLNNQIEKLEMEIKGLKDGESKAGDGVAEKRKGKNLLMNHQDEEVKSNPEMKTSIIRITNNNEAITQIKPLHITQRTTQVPVSETVCNQQPPSPTKKHKSEIQLTKQLNGESKTPQDTSNYLKSILQITDIAKFNQKHLKKAKKQPSIVPVTTQLQSMTLKQLSQLIITEINLLEKRVTSLTIENKKLKDQSSRLLAILKRKEESWVPLFQQKDDIISLYEKALICLQKGYVLAEEPLRSRIQLIVEKVSSVQFINQGAQDDMSNRDTNSVLNSSIIDDDLGDEFLPPGTLQSSASQKNISAKKQKQKKSRNSTAIKKDKQKQQDTYRLKKKVKKQSQCDIF